MLNDLNALDANISASAARADASSARGQTDDLAKRIGAIELTVETLYRLGVQQNSFTEEQFVAMTKVIDAEDGVLDGRRDLGRMVKVCGQCGKNNPATRAACMWCDFSLADAKPVQA